MVTKPFDLTRTTLAVLSILGLIAVSFLILQPFLAATVWAATLVVATWPMMRRAQSAFGGRRGPAVALMTLGLQPWSAGGTDKIDWNRGANHG
jgi:predicted PurR-regulated permease PerM